MLLIGYFLITMVSELLECTLTNSMGMLATCSIGSGNNLVPFFFTSIEI